MKSLPVFDKTKNVLIGLASLSAFIIMWQIVTMAADSPFLPSPVQVLYAFIKISTFGDIDGYTLGWHTAVSLYRVLLGFIVAVITAIPLGLLMGVKPFVKSAASPIIESLRFIPPIAWIPLSIILLSGINRYIFLLWIGIFFPILLDTIAGVKRASIIQVNMAKSFGADNRTIIRNIIFPSALPEIMNGLRVGLGVGWMCIVAAEMIGGEPVGLGRLILKYANLLQIDVVVLGMVVIGIVGLVMNYLLLSAEKRLFKWRVEIKA